MRRKSKSARRRGSKKDDQYAPTGSAPDEAEGVSPTYSTVRERDMESAVTMDLGAVAPTSGTLTGKKQKAAPQPPQSVQPAADKPASILSVKKERKRLHRRHRKQSAAEADEGNLESTAGAALPGVLKSDTVAGAMSSAQLQVAATPGRKASNGTRQTSPRMAVMAPGSVFQGATATTSSLAGGTQQAAIAPRPPTVATSFTSSTTAPAAQYPPEPPPAGPAHVTRAVMDTGTVADFSKVTPSDSERQPTVARTAAMAASVAPVPGALQKKDEGSTALRELPKQQSELPTADSSTSTVGGTLRTPARQSGAIRQQSSTLARTTAKLAIKPSIQEEEEESASEDEEEALATFTRRQERRASKVFQRDQAAQPYRSVTQPPETQANTSEQLNFPARSRTIPADSVVLAPDVANKLVSVLSRVENLASEIVSQNARESVKSSDKGNATPRRANLCAKCRAAERKARGSTVDAEQLSEDGSDEEEAGVPGRSYDHKRKQRKPAPPRSTQGSKYNAPEDTMEQNDGYYGEGFSWDENERENCREDAEPTGVPRRRSRRNSSLHNRREVEIAEQAVRSGTMYDWVDPIDDTRNTSRRYIYQEPPPFMRSQRFLPPYWYGGPQLDYRSYRASRMQPPYLQPNSMLYLNSARPPLVPLANQSPYQISQTALTPSNLELYPQVQGYFQEQPLPPRTPPASYRYPQIYPQNGGSVGPGGQLQSSQPFATRPGYSTGTAYGKQQNQAYNYSQAFQNCIASNNANSTRPDYQPHSPQTVRNLGPGPGMPNTTTVPSQSSLAFETMDASSVRCGGSPFSIAVNPKQQASDIFHDGPATETGVARTALLQSRNASREERPLPAKKLIAGSMNNSAPTTAYRPPAASTSPGPAQQPVPSTSDRRSAETMIACYCKCHSCAAEGHDYQDGQEDVSLEKLLRHEDDLRWDEQLRERSRVLREEKIRQEERLHMRRRLQDQERLLREERQFRDDLERRREADRALQRELEREGEAEARANAAVIQLLVSTRTQEIARPSGGAGQHTKAAAEQEVGGSSSDDDAVFASVSSTLGKPENKTSSERRCSDAGIQLPQRPLQQSRAPLREASPEQLPRASGSMSARESSINTASTAKKVPGEPEKLHDAKF
ncbi:uncharacterized protein [Dermacentor albipictus]|uniref:uncharacterized protein n=1 Tax=Dermacentor albipictus TaxID=60249 RepID=UPI0038FCD501